MVTISNGRESRYVTVGAFNTIYKDKGYKIVDGAKKKPVEKKPVKEVKEISEIAHEEPVEVVGVAESTMEEDWVTELLEKPISQWSKEETASFAKEKGIDTSSAHKLSEAKDIIKKWLDEQNR